MRLLLLNELYLNKNKLESLDGIVYLPSLQVFYYFIRFYKFKIINYRLVMIPNIQSLTCLIFNKLIYLVIEFNPLVP